METQAQRQKVENYLSWYYTVKDSRDMQTREKQAKTKITVLWLVWIIDRAFPLLPLAWANLNLGPVHAYPEIFVSSIFFMRIQKYLPHVAYTNRIRPSTRIGFVSGHLKGLVNRARAKKEWFSYCDVYVYKNIRIWASTRIRIHSVHRNFHSGERIQKSPDTPSVYGGHVGTLGISA